jgi:hypothetical protein
MHISFDGPDGVELSISDLLIRALGALQEESPAAYEVLLPQIQSGFFERPFSKPLINNLAGELLKATDLEEGWDAP